MRHLLLVVFCWPWTLWNKWRKPQKEKDLTPEEIVEAEYAPIFHGHPALQDEVGLAEMWRRQHTYRDYYEDDPVLI